jgi:alpha-ketoglutarate-dependent taurine dioxygenase
MRRELQAKDGTQSKLAPTLSGLTGKQLSNSITFEHVPSDYAILQIKTLPEDAGGDTLWASGYEVYDRLSPTWQRIADGLTATHYAVR